MPRPTEQLVIDTVRLAGGNRPAARLLNDQGWDISESAIRRMFGKMQGDEGQGFSVDLPGGTMASDIDIEELISRRKAQYERKLENHTREKIVPIRVHMDGPIGIGFVGDPHVDDDGTDIAQVFDHARIFDGRNPGMFAGNIGDITNNWAGRLARLWGDQSTSAAEARALATEYLQMVRWLFFISGNHDCWQGGSDILSYILQQNAPVKKDARVRMAIRLPNGRNVKIFAAHHFPGRSAWSEVYGGAKRAQLDGANDIYVSGHIHTSGYTHGWNDPQSRMWHALQIASYKKLDDYVEELNLERKDLYNCPVALIDPYATSDINFIRFEFDPHEAAERLKWMRTRWEQAKTT
jgi:hypothetical protein